MLVSLCAGIMVGMVGMIMVGMKTWPNIGCVITIPHSFCPGGWGGHCQPMSSHSGTNRDENDGNGHDNNVDRHYDSCHS